MKEKVQAPELRFPGFTDDWELRKLGEITEVITKGSTPLDKSWSGPVNYVKTESINKDNGQISMTANTSLEEHENYLKRSKLKDGDLLFSIVGTLGRVGLVEEKDLPANTNQQISIIRLCEGDKYFLFNTLKTHRIISFIKSDATIGAQPSLSLWQIEGLSVPFPNIKEQVKIGSFFKQLDTTITLHQRKLDLLKEQKKGYLQKMFPKNGAKVPELRFAGFADDWEERKLGEVYNFQYGQFNNNPDNGGQYPIYGANGIIGGYDEYNSENAIVIGHMGAYAGHVLWAEGKHFVTYNGTMGIADKSILNSNFGYYLVVSVNVPKLTSGSGQPFVSYSDLNGIKILIPTIEEQQKIGSFFKQLDDTIALHQRKLDLLKEQKKGFLQQMFV
ncbi:restriction endonuclease subunit S [Lactococcus lactis]|uniref:restriction endonuclease subunit S n=1 Tax=Lactococcus lactis TaxID=1358 RepID=UPI0022E7082F|nr:restriction endonuclease subunit S [Lactococcus lactis]